MVPDPRTWLSGPRRVLRERRWLALLLGLVAGGGALAAALTYAHPSLHQWFLLPLGVGGTTYYLALYESAWWSDEPTGRGFLRNFAMLLLALAYVGEEATLVEGLLSQVTVLSVVLFAMVTTAVSAGSRSEADGDDEDATASTRDPPWRRRGWRSKREDVDA